MKKKKIRMIIIMILLITTGILLAVNYFAVKKCMGNLKMFTFFVLVVPLILVAAAAFSIGYLAEFRWKMNACMALLLTLLSFGAGQLTSVLSEGSFDNMKSTSVQENMGNSSDEELMNELYAELDKKAYEYMLEQGLIAEGDAVYAGEGTMEGQLQGGGSVDIDKTEISSSELYVGIQKSDPMTEMLGNVLTFLIAFGLAAAGAGMRRGAFRIL